MLKERFGSAIDRVLLRAVPVIEKLPLSANQLTMAGVALSAAAGLAFAAGLIPLGGLLLMPAGFADLTDGIVARARGTASRAGAFLDSSMDRVSDFAIFAGLLVHAAAQGEPRRAALIAWALSAAALTSYVRARAECEIPELRAGFMERAERFLILIPLAIIDQIGLGLWIIAIGSTATAVQRLALGYNRIADAELEAEREPSAQ